MNAVVNRIMRTAERAAPNLRTWGAKLALARAITAAIPAHCNESVSVTRTTAALVWRMKIMCKGHEFHFELISSDPVGAICCSSTPDCQFSQRGSIYSSTTGFTHSIEQTTGTSMVSLRDRHAISCY